MVNTDFMKYTYMHRKAFEFTVMKMIKNLETRRLLLLRARKHDLDKQMLYTLIGKKESSAWHRANSSHHMENDIQKNYYDMVEAVIDYECAGYTKPDKSRNAYDTVIELKPAHSDELMQIIRQLGAAEHYRNTPQDEDWIKYCQTIPEPTDENMMDEIYWYITAYPGYATRVYQYATEVKNSARA